MRTTPHLRQLAVHLILLLLSWSGTVVAQTDVDGDLAALRDIVESQQATIEQLDNDLRSLSGQLDRLDPPAAEPDSNGDYDGGFVIGETTGEEGNTGFRMRVGSWGQLRHNFFESDGPNLDQNDLDLERLRLVFDGYAFNKDFRYFFQLDADSDANEVVDMLDYYVTYDLGHDMLCLEKDRLALRFGKWKVGFNRAREESGTRMQFSDRSMASVLFDFDRSIGVGLLGSIDSTIGPVDWQLTVANGIDTGGFRPSRANELDRNLAVASRVNWLATGDWGNDGHADLDGRTAPAIRLGTGFTFSRPDVEGAREFDFPRVVDSGTNLSAILPAGVSAYNMFMHSVDLNTKYRGISLVFEYYFRHFSDFEGAAVQALFDHGYWAEAGYFISPERVQLIARHSRIVGDSATLGAVNQSADEVAGGIVIYAQRHRLKLTFDATHLNGAPINDSALNIRPGDAGWLYRTQLQWKF